MLQGKAKMVMVSRQQVVKRPLKRDPMWRDDF